MSALRKFSQEFAPWGRDQTAKKIKAAQKSFRREELVVFQKECLERMESYEKSQPTRAVSALETHHIIHTLALDTTGHANTMMNNEVVGNITPEEGLKRVLAGNLTLSCSAILKNTAKPRTEQRFCLQNEDGTNWFSSGRRKREDPGTMYPFGVIFKEGTILAAYRNDAGSLLEKGKPHRKSKSDPETKNWAFQTNVEAAIANALELHTRFTDYKGHTGLQMGADLNELVVAKTEPAALFFNLDSPWCISRSRPGEKLFGEDVRILIAEVEAMVKQHPELPFLIQYEGKPVEIIHGKKGMETREGETLSAMVDGLLNKQAAAVTTLRNSTFAAIQAHMWANAEMTGPDEVQYLNNGGPSEKDLLTRDTRGRTALHTAAESGRTRHLATDLLERYADVVDDRGNTLKDTLASAQRPLENAYTEEAHLRSLKLSLLKGGPILIEDAEGKPLWAVGTTPNGAVLCTDSRGSSITCGINWYLSRNMLEYLFLETEKKGKSTKALELLASQCPENNSTFNTAWIQAQKLAGALEEYTKTPSPETNPKLQELVVLTSISTVAAPTKSLQAAQNILRTPETMDGAIKAIRTATKEIASVWEKLFKREPAGIN